MAVAKIRIERRTREAGAGHHLVDRQLTQRAAAQEALGGVEDLALRLGDASATAVGTHGDSFAGTLLIACSASAVIVRLGFTPTLAGTAAPSQTSRFS